MAVISGTPLSDVEPKHPIKIKKKERKMCKINIVCKT